MAESSEPMQRDEVMIGNFMGWWFMVSESRSCSAKAVPEIFDLPQPSRHERISDSEDS